MLLSDQFKRKLAVLSAVEAAALAMYGIFAKNPSALPAAALFLSAALCRTYGGTHSALTLILIFYGTLSRSAFAITGSLYGNMYISVPLLYILFESPMIFSALMKTERKTAGGIVLYTLFALVYALYGDGSSVFSRLISFCIMILPLYYYIDSADIMRDIVKPMFISSPIVLSYALFQYFGIYIPTDLSYVSHFSSTLLSTLKLGSSVRPFSSFSSPEEFSYFLMLISLFSYFMKNRAAKTAGILSVCMLLLFSYRTAFFIFAALSLYHLLRIGRRMAAMILISAVMLVMLALHFAPIDTVVKKGDGRILSAVKHGVEPAKNLLSTYSLSRRIEVAKNNMQAFKERPFGYGLSHNFRVTGERGNVFGSESSLIQLILSGGIVFLLFLIVFYVFSFARLAGSEYGYAGMAGAAFLIMLPLSHILSFHFVLPLLYAALIRSLNGRN